MYTKFSELLGSKSIFSTSNPYDGTNSDYRKTILSLFEPKESHSDSDTPTEETDSVPLISLLNIKELVVGKHHSLEIGSDTSTNLLLNAKLAVGL